MILGMPSALKRMLADLRSRCTMPAWWAASIAMTSGTIHSAACLGGSTVPISRSIRLPPSSSSSATYGRAVVFADVVDLQDIGVAERGDRFRLDLEAGDLDFVGIGAPDHLQGDEPVQPAVAGLVDDAHAAAAELTAGSRSPAVRWVLRRPRRDWHPARSFEVRAVARRQNRWSCPNEGRRPVPRTVAD